MLTFNSAALTADGVGTETVGTIGPVVVTAPTTVFGGEVTMIGEAPGQTLADPLELGAPAVDDWASGWLTEEIRELAPRWV